jgi:hypothetical protein
MKKLVAFLLIAILCIGLCPGVFAQSGIQTLDGRYAVSTSGACSVDLTVTLLLKEAAQPVFPLPAEASDITLNGQRGSVSNNGAYKQLSLSAVTGGNAGSYTFHIHYSLPGVVDPGEEGLELTLPLLCGFGYPVENLSFSVSLPSEVTTEPLFASSYYQELIAAQLDVAVNGNTLSGHTKALKDHETLSMTLPVTDAMFPQAAVTARVMGLMDIMVLVFVLLAVTYFLLTMRPRWVHMEQRTTAPDGVSAGDLQMWLTGSGVDLSLLVVTWAQLGYLRIQVDDNGRVLLHKRMDMGNERSRFENRCFRSLFGPRRIVDGTGYHYAHLCSNMWKKTPRIKEIYMPRSGNPKILRGISLIAGMLSGVLLASAFAPHSLFLKILLALVTAVLSLEVQAGGCAMPKRNKIPLWIGLGCAGVWMLLGVFSDEVLLCFLIILFQFSVGLATAYGGRRTPLGHQTMQQIVNLRRHMKHGQDLPRLHKVNPNYFHELAPYALSLGLEKTFARHFDRLKLQECNYLIVGNRRQMTASEWARALRSVVDTLDAKAKRLPLERFTRR